MASTSVEDRSQFVRDVGFEVGRLESIAASIRQTVERMPDGPDKEWLLFEANALRISAIAIADLVAPNPMSVSARMALFSEAA